MEIVSVAVVAVEKGNGLFVGIHQEQIRCIGQFHKAQQVVFVFIDGTVS